MFYLIAFTGLLIVVLKNFLSIFNQWRSNPTPTRPLPPGPKGWPLIGTWIPVEGPHLKYVQMAKQYGPVFSYYAGKQLTVILNDYHLIKEAFVTKGDALENRPPQNEEEYGVIISRDELWKEQRRFLIVMLRKLGVFDSNKMEHGILSECEQLVREIDSSEGKPSDFKVAIANAIANVLSTVAFQHRFEYTDKAFKPLMESVNNWHIFRSISLIFFYPGAQFFAKYIGKVRHQIEIYREASVDVRRRLEPLIQEHKQSFDIEKEPENYIHAFIKQQRTGKGKYFSDKQLSYMVQHLFMGSCDPETVTIRWAIMYCAANPEVQEKCYQQIMEHVGSDRTPKLEDRQNLAYVDATIHEVQRMCNIFPLITRHASKDMEIAGYHIPKGTIVCASAYNVHMNPNSYPMPREFKPERWLNDDGHMTPKEDFIPFGLGRRYCVGVALARMELFLIFTSLLQRYQFSFTTKSEPAPEDGMIMGDILFPRNFLICAKKREHLSVVQH